MHIPTEIWDNILFEYTKFNMSHSGILHLVSREFNKIKNTVINKKIEDLMNISIDILVTIAWFVDRKDADFIDYLIGPMMISKFNNNNIDNILPKSLYCNDEYNSRRVLDSVVLSNIKMGLQFGPEIYGLDIHYSKMVKYYRNDNNELICNTISVDESLNDIESNIYWLYIFEELCHYCKTYSYMILPYYDDSIKQKNGSFLYTIYQLNIDKMIYIDDSYTNEDALSPSLVVEYDSH